MMAIHAQIDRIAKEGAVFTDLYAQRPAPRDARAFITGSRPSAPACSKSACRAPRKGCPRRIRRLSELLKPQGYATGQFGKNHLGTATSTCRRCTDSMNSGNLLPPQRGAGTRE